MAFDLIELGSKLKQYRKQFQFSQQEIADATGVPVSTIAAYETGALEPSGDHILILADFYRCDFKFFLSNQKLAPFEQTDTLFRKYSNELSKADRWAIQEFLFLCECEADILKEMPAGNRIPFRFQKQGTFLKQHGIDAADSLRMHLNLKPNAVFPDVFHTFRDMGIHVFRRSLTNSDISGLFIRHPTAGPCILVNYAEDVYRQRLTAAHEVGHFLLDDVDQPMLTTRLWDTKDLSEIRAFTFATHLLIPPVFLQHLNTFVKWDDKSIVYWASQLKVSTSALAKALKDQAIITDATAQQLRKVRVPFQDKTDPELPTTMSPASRTRKQEILKRGLSTYYVGLCFDAYGQDIISAGRLAEMLLADDSELPLIAELYGRSLAYGH